MKGMALFAGSEARCLINPSYQLNVWDVGGQTTIRSYWRNYFEQVSNQCFALLKRLDRMYRPMASFGSWTVQIAAG